MSNSEKKLLLWGFCEDVGARIVDELMSRYRVVKWYSTGQASESLIELRNGNYPHPKQQTEPSSMCASHLYEGAFPMFQVLATRRGIETVNIHQLADEFHLGIRYFVEVLTEAKPDVCVFSNIPHEGPDYLLYVACCTLRLPTLLCYQTIIPGAFMTAASIDDFGAIENMPYATKIANYSVTPGFKEDLFYMRSVSSGYHAGASGFKQQVRRLKGTAGAIQKAIISGITRTSRDSILISAIYYCARTLRFLRNRQYDVNFNRYVVVWDSMNHLELAPHGFVYFPLHLQPELTTAALGGKFHDQMLALETLRRLLPSDIVLVVKENPKQRHYQRDPSFFTRLANLSNTVLVGRTTSSESLIRHALITATITGTAGWEAMKGGKPVLTFGRAWYRSLPRCLEYSSGLNWQSICAFVDAVGNKDGFDIAVCDFLKRLPSGIVDPAYRVTDPKFDIDRNSVAVADAIEKALMHRKLL